MSARLHCMSATFPCMPAINLHPPCCILPPNSKPRSMGAPSPCGPKTPQQAALQPPALLRTCSRA